MGGDVRASHALSRLSIGQFAGLVSRVHRSSRMKFGGKLRGCYAGACYVTTGGLGMKSRTKRNGQVSTRICAVISACMLIVLSLPACTGGALPSARSTAQNEPSPVRQQIDVMPVHEPLVFGDETSKSLPAEENEEPAGACSDALYIEEPLASGYVPVSEPLWLLCNKQLAACGKACHRKKTGATKTACYKACNAEYMLCLQATGLTTRFTALDKAWEWINAHKAGIVGTIVIVGGIVYIVSTSGAGALILVPLGV